MRVAPLVAAERAQLAFGEVVAAPAPRHPLLGVDDRGREPLRVLGRGLQEIERDALRRLRADAGQPAELVDERLDRPFVDRHASGLAEQSAETAAEAAEPAEVEPGRDATELLLRELLRLARSLR